MEYYSRHLSVWLRVFTIKSPRSLFQVASLTFMLYQHTAVNKPPIHCLHQLLHSVQSVKVCIDCLYIYIYIYIHSYITETVLSSGSVAVNARLNWMFGHMYNIVIQKNAPYFQGMQVCRSFTSVHAAYHCVYTTKVKVPILWQNGPCIILQCILCINICASF